MTYEEARDYLRAAGALDDVGELMDFDTGEQPYLCWGAGDATAHLDGRFTADDLEAIAVFMRGERK